MGENNNVSRSVFERCFYSFLQYRKEKLELAQRQQKILEAQYQYYMRYRHIGNLIFRYLLIHDFIEDKPQTVLDIMDDQNFNCSSSTYFNYRWGYRGATTRERFEHSLTSYLSTALGCQVRIKCSETCIHVSFL